MADCFLSLAGSDRELLGERAWDALWTIDHGHRRADVVALLDTDHRATSRRALVSLARASQPLAESHQAAVRKAMEHPDRSIREAALHATGLQAPHLLPTPLETQDRPDAAGIRWWRRVGGMIRDYA